MIKNNLIEKIIITFVLLIITILILSGCMFASKTLTEDNNGQNLSLKTDETVKIKLESNITTGFRWNLSNKTDASIVSLISSDYKQSNTDTKLAGAGGYETFTFKANSKGNTTIILTYNKPWEEGVEPLKTFKINLTVE
jgi:inhibitor of cysteine peptidase